MQTNLKYNTVWEPLMNASSFYKSNPYGATAYSRCFHHSKVSKFARSLWTLHQCWETLKCMQLGFLSLNLDNYKSLWFVHNQRLYRPRRKAMCVSNIMLELKKQMGNLQIICSMLCILLTFQDTLYKQVCIVYILWNYFRLAQFVGARARVSVFHIHISVSVFDRNLCKCNAENHKLSTPF